MTDSVQTGTVTIRDDLGNVDTIKGVAEDEFKMACVWLEERRSSPVSAFRLTDCESKIHAYNCDKVISMTFAPDRPK